MPLTEGELTVVIYIYIYIYIYIERERLYKYTYVHTYIHSYIHTFTYTSSLAWAQAQAPAWAAAGLGGVAKESTGRKVGGLEMVAVAPRTGAEPHVRILQCYRTYTLYIYIYI